MSDDIKLSALRLPLDLHAKIVAASRENSRSQHAEMLHRIQASFNTPDAAPGYDGLAKAQLDRLEAKLDAMNPERVVVTNSLSDEAYDGLLRVFESAGRRGPSSPTGRLSESQPELRDLPFVTGLSSLTATLRPLDYGGFYNGGFCGMPEGELPKILEPGEQVCSQEKWDQAQDRSDRWVENTGEVPEGVKVGSRLDLRTNAPGGPVLGHIYGKGSSKGEAIWPKKGRIYVTHWRFSREDKPQAFAEHVTTYAGVTADGAWIENTGSRPLQLKQEMQIEVRQRPHGHVVRYQVGQLPRSHWQSTRGNLPRISHWRLAE